jgi:hypothetical protein
MLSIPLASLVCLQFSMQKEDTIKHINGKCHVLIISYSRGKYYGAY